MKVFTKRTTNVPATQASIPAVPPQQPLALSAGVSLCSHPPCVIILCPQELVSMSASDHDFLYLPELSEKCYDHNFVKCQDISCGAQAARFSAYLEKLSEARSREGLSPCNQQLSCLVWPGPGQAEREKGEHSTPRFDPALREVQGAGSVSGKASMYAGGLLPQPGVPKFQPIPQP